MLSGVKSATSSGWDTLKSNVSDSRESPDHGDDGGLWHDYQDDGRDALTWSNVKSKLSRDGREEHAPKGGAPLGAGALTGVGAGAGMIGTIAKLGSSGGRLRGVGSSAKSFAGSTKGKLSLAGLGGLGLGAAGEGTDSAPSLNPFSGDGVGFGSQNTPFGADDLGGDGSGFGVIAVAVAAAAALALVFGGGR